MKNNRSWGLLIFLLFPTLLILGVFIFYPAIDSFYLSLMEVAPFSLKTTFIGFDNYTMLLQSPEYWQSLRVSLGFMLMTVLPSVSFSLLIALALDSNPYFRSLFRTIFLLPVAISSAMAAMLWIFFYNPSTGYLNYLLELIDLQGPNWLGSGKWALLAVAITSIWRELGFNIIFFIAGLASIPNDVREASQVDGANSLQRFYYIILPMLGPTLLFVSVVSMISSFQSFGQIHILTAGGPAGSTNTLVYNLYRDAFQNFQTGSASAQAIVLFLIILLITCIQFSFSKRNFLEEKN